MNKIKNALTRKLGPLPAWAWAMLLFGAVYFYQKYHSSTASGTGTGSVSPTPATPQPQTVLQPGESVYDPNTGALTTAPGGGGSGDTTGSDAADLASAMDSLASAIATGMPPQQVDIVDGTSPNDATTNNVVGVPSGQLTKASVAKIGSAGKALTSPGVFSALTKGRRGAAKSKGQNNATKKTSKYTPKGSTTRARSAATTRNTGGGRTKSASKIGGGLPISISRRSTRAGNVASRARQPARTPAVHTVVQQRRPAVTPRPAPTRQGGAPAPRPSAPPPRTQRTPQKPPPPRKRTR